MEARTCVGIVGAGPAGLLLSQLLGRAAIESVVLEARDRPHVEGRVRAGVLEQGTVETLAEAGASDRLVRESLRHHGIVLRFRGEDHLIDVERLTGGRTVTVYGQQEVVKDLIAARLSGGGRVEFGAEVTAIEGFDDGRPVIRYRQDGVDRVLRCDAVAGCDGFHGVARRTVADRVTMHGRDYPFGWLGILAEAPPASDIVIYANHADGFALLSMRSPTISRLYLQVPADDDADRWSDGAIWDALDLRLTGKAGGLARGPIIQKGVTPMRSFVAEPMRFGDLFLAGDAAHIVPPTGAKGMNLAVADVRTLARALIGRFRDGRTDLADAYSETCLRRIWQVQRFSWWVTGMMHNVPGETSFDAAMRTAQLDDLVGSEAGSRGFAENYAGLPYDGPWNPVPRATRAAP
jgi:p-hydroxybenzoate 3-monooxygenase